MSATKEKGSTVEPGVDPQVVGALRPAATLQQAQLLGVGAALPRDPLKSESEHFHLMK